MPAKRKSDQESQTSSPSKKGKHDDGTTGLASHVETPEAHFSCSNATKDGRKWTQKFVSLNVNGFRAFLKKGGMDYIRTENPDVMCFQETKCPEKEIPTAELEKTGFKCYFLSGDKSGYSGVGMIYKRDPLSITPGIGVDKHDNEGRVITAEYDTYYLVTAYVPNSQKGLKRLEYRTKEWDEDFRKYLAALEEKKPVILCGDLNVAHQEIDLKNPKSNKNKTPGFCDAEREGLSKLIDEGFLDTFRHLYPDKKDAYSFWTYMMNARAKNVGWRLDYWIISNKLKTDLCDSVMRSDVMGSDHCPIALFMAM